MQAWLISDRKVTEQHILRHSLISRAPLQKKESQKIIMKHQRTINTGNLVPSPASLLTHRLTAALTGGLSIITLLFVFLAVGSANAQSYIRFTLTQERVTVPVNYTNSTVITN